MQAASRGGAAISGQTTRPTVADIAKEVRLFASLDQSAFTNRHAWLYIVITLTHLTDGFDLLMIGVVLPGIVAAFKLTPPEAGFLASSVFLGMTVGAITITYLGDLIGRKKALLICVVLYGVLGLLAAAAWDYRTILTMRLLQGLGLGAEIPLVVTYLLEFVPMRRRGLLAATTISLWQFAGLFAALAAILIIPAFSWRGMFVLGAIPALVLAVILAYLPESVRYLLHRNRVVEAEQIVRCFSSIDPDKVVVQAKATQAPASVRLRDILRGKYLRYTLGAWIMSMSWAMAFFGMAVWLPSILMHIGFTQVHSFTYTAAITGAGGTGVFLSGISMDWLGRRATMASCFIVGGLCMIGWGFSTTPRSILLFGMVTAFTGIGGVAGCLFTYICEIYPTQFRATGAGLATAWQRIGGIIAPSILGLLIGAKGAVFGSFGLLGINLIIGGIAAVALTYETRGKSLERISTDLAS